MRCESCLGKLPDRDRGGFRDGKGLQVGLSAGRNSYLGLSRFGTDGLVGCRCGVGDRQDGREDSRCEGSSKAICMFKVFTIFFFTFYSDDERAKKMG